MSATHIRIDGIVLIVSLLVASLFILLGVSFYTLNDNIELKLIDDVTERLNEEGYQINIDFDGRDGVLKGSVNDEQTLKEIISISKSVAGVRTIKNEITIATTDNDVPADNNLEGDLSAITINNDDDKNIESLDSLEEKTSSITTPLTDIDAPAPSSPSQNTTEKIEQEKVIFYKGKETNLSTEHLSILSSITPLLDDDTSLFIEIFSSYKDSSIAIKRANTIEEFFKNKGVNKRHFKVIWDDSSSKNQVKLKIFHIQ